MSNPSFSNIDLWLFELAEGNLTPAQIEKLELFLMQHPELDVERDVWEMARLTKKDEVYADSDKHHKRRPIGWYVGGSVAAVTAVVLSFLVFDINVERSGRLSFNTTGNKEVRVLVKSGDISTSDAVLGDQATGITNSTFSTNETVTDISSVLSIENISINNRSDVRTEEGNHELANVNETNTSSVQTEQNLNEVVQVDHNEYGAENSVDNVYDVSNNLEINSVSEFDIRQEQTLVPHVVKEIAVLQSNDYQLIAQSSFNSAPTGHETFSSEYKMTMKMKLSRFARNVQRMMDNPVALQNFRDPNYHVPGMLPTDINFSSTGTMLSTRIQSLTRLQWYGQENEMFQNQLAVDGYIYGIRGGVGLQINHNWYNRGGINISSVALTYSPKISLSKTVSLEPSLRFKMGNKALTASKMEGVQSVEVERGISRDFYSDNSTPIGSQLWYKDLGAGIMVNTEWFFVGVQLDNMLRHKDNIYQQDYDNPRRAGNHFIASFGTDWVSRNENLGLSPYVVYQNKENLSEAWLGANFRWQWFTIGASISSNMEPAASMGMKFKSFALMYNADYTKSEMTGRSGLSQQLTLRFVGKPSRIGRRILNL